MFWKRVRNGYKSHTKQDYIRKNNWKSECAQRQSSCQSELRAQLLVCDILGFCLRMLVVEISMLLCCNYLHNNIGIFIADNFPVL